MGFSGHTGGRRQRLLSVAPESQAPFQCEYASSRDIASCLLTTAHALQYLEKPSRWAVHTTAVLPTYVTGRVAILGDAVRIFQRVPMSIL